MMTVFSSWEMIALYACINFFGKVFGDYIKELMRQFVLFKILRNNSRFTISVVVITGVAYILYEKKRKEIALAYLEK